MSPAFGILRAYIVGFDELSQAIGEAWEKARASNESVSRIDLTKFECEGVKALDEHTLQITIRGKYPQFDNWMAMAFFAPMPWEAEAFYANPGFAENNISLNTWPVGTGPYMLAVSRQNREHVLERNPNYRGLTYRAKVPKKTAETAFWPTAAKRRRLWTESC